MWLQLSIVRFPMRLLIVFLNLSNPTIRTMELGFTCNRYEYQKIFLEVRTMPAFKSDNLTAICVPIV
jgi:hypothetical protein